MCIPRMAKGTDHVTPHAAQVTSQHLDSKSRDPIDGHNMGKQNDTKHINSTDVLDGHFHLIVLIVTVESLAVPLPKASVGNQHPQAGDFLPTPEVAQSQRDKEVVACDGVCWNG